MSKGEYTYQILRRKQIYTQTERQQVDKERLGWTLDWLPFGCLLATL